MHEQIVTLLIYIIPALVASQGLWTYLLYRRQRHDEVHDLRAKADLAILHDLIYRYCKEAIIRGYTTFDEFDNMSILYGIYHEYGGNGTGDKLYQEFCSLPAKEKIEKMKQEETNA